MDSEQNHAPRCLLIAPLENHATVGRVAALAGSGYVVSVADVSIDNSAHAPGYPFDRLARVYDLNVAKTDPIYSTTGKRRLFAWLADWLRSNDLLPESRRLSRRIVDAIDDSRPDIVVTFYGPIAIHYARVVKRMRPDLPVVTILNLIPSTIVAARNRWARWLRHVAGSEFTDFRNWLHHMDGIVFASKEMRDFVTSKFPGIAAKSAIVPDYLPRSFQGADLSPRVSRGIERPAVIFLGAPERYGGRLDAPDDQFIALGRAGIHVYSAQMNEEALASPFCHLYPRLTNEEVFSGGLAEYARGFDAVLITYNISKRHERFRSTLPTRFLSALTTGIPIAVRGGLYDACEEFIREHQNGFVFSTVDELRDILSDSDRMRHYRDRATALRPMFTAERQGEQLQTFMDSVRAAS